ncbi:hypothetical protein BCR37DRAFT_380194 [Protomyces lactucae-debilis]|uniref:Uncharacterized protein n=1 Tax=Protomyces lactucae-debilis TaxID=2754530 RepID=A0A1Y2FBV8_PROLT|nr:uncharacterized protein BCR37DRAFT_380194 [Protomyces lactucae-debilis]ORY81381.1 hypothetical protein BCR37DRAFT_380194 [Protomyces lactucae-debilis]
MLLANSRFLTCSAAASARRKAILNSRLFFELEPDLFALRQRPPLQMEPCRQALLLFPTPLLHILRLSMSSDYLPDFIFLCVYLYFVEVLTCSQRRIVRSARVHHDL